MLLRRSGMKVAMVKGWFGESGGLKVAPHHKPGFPDHHFPTFRRGLSQLPGSRRDRFDIYLIISGARGAPGLKSPEARCKLCRKGITLKAGGGLQQEPYTDGKPLSCQV